MPPQIQTKTVSVTNTRLAIATLALVCAAALAFAATTTIEDQVVCEPTGQGVVIVSQTAEPQLLNNYCLDSKTLNALTCNDGVQPDDPTKNNLTVSTPESCTDLYGDGGMGGRKNDVEGCFCKDGYFLREGRCLPNLGNLCEDSDGGSEPNVKGFVKISMQGVGAPENELQHIDDYCINDTTLVEGVCREGVYQAEEVNCGQEGSACNSVQGRCVALPI